MGECGGFEGTATELLAALTERVRKPERDAAEAHRKAVAERDQDLQVLTAAKLREAQQGVRDVMSSGWPKKPQVLSARLKKVGPQLRKIGIAITWPTSHHGRRKISISRQVMQPAEKASQASPASQRQGRKSNNRNEHNNLDEGDASGNGDAVGRTGDAVWRKGDAVGGNGGEAPERPQMAPERPEKPNSVPGVRPADSVNQLNARGNWPDSEIGGDAWDIGDAISPKFPALRKEEICRSRRSDLRIRNTPRNRPSGLSSYDGWRNARVSALSWR